MEGELEVGNTRGKKPEEPIAITSEEITWDILGGMKPEDRIGSYFRGRFQKYIWKNLIIFFNQLNVGVRDKEIIKKIKVLRNKYMLRYTKIVEIEDNIGFRGKGDGYRHNKFSVPIFTEMGLGDSQMLSND